MKYNPKHSTTPKPPQLDLEAFDELELLLSEEIAIRYLENARWNTIITCHVCNSTNVRRSGFYQRDNIAQMHQCVDCGKKFTYLTDTMFSDSVLKANQQLLILVLLAQDVTVARISDLLNLMVSHIKTLETKFKIALNDPPQMPFIQRIIKGINTEELLFFAQNYANHLQNHLQNISLIEQKEKKPMPKPKKNSKNTTQSPTFIGTTEAAKILGTSIALLSQWRRKKKHMPFKLIDGVIKYDIVDVEKVKEERRIAREAPIIADEDKKVDAPENKSVLISTEGTPPPEIGVKLKIVVDHMTNWWTLCGVGLSCALLTLILAKSHQYESRITELEVTVKAWEEMMRGTNK